MTMDADQAMYLTRLKPTPERAGMLAEAFRLRARETMRTFRRRDVAYVVGILEMEAMRELTADERRIVAEEIARG